MTLLIAGYFPTTYFPNSYWIQDYWPEYGIFKPLLLLVVGDFGFSLTGDKKIYLHVGSEMIPLKSSDSVKHIFLLTRELAIGSKGGE